MANILGLKNFLKSDGTERLSAVYGNDSGVFDGVSTFAGQGRNLSPQKMEFDIFLDYLLGVNATNNNQVYDGTTWFTGGARTRMPISRYIKTVGNKAYLADLTYISTRFRSRVWHSDLPFNNDIRWGYESGTNLNQTANSKVVQSTNSGFSSYGIKTGDPFFITTGANAGEYTVDTVDGDQQITLTEELKNTVSNSTFWVGDNYFDIRSSAGDYIRGLGENDNKLLIFEREALHRYNESEARRVKGVPGTTSHRSVVNKDQNTYYFHESGVWRYDSVTSFLISRPIQDWIEGISSDNYPNVVSWVEDDNLFMFVGDIVNTKRNISITNGLLIYDTAAQAWNIGSLNNVVTCSDVAVADEKIIYLGTSDDKILQWNSGAGDLGNPIPFQAKTIFHFPPKNEDIVEFVKVEIHTYNGRGIKVAYRLYTTDKVETVWQPLGEIRKEIEILEFPRGVFGRGIAFGFFESSTREDIVISRIDVSYKDREARTIPLPYE